MSDILTLQVRICTNIWVAQDAMSRARDSAFVENIDDVDCHYITSQCEHAITALQVIIDLVEEQRVGYASLGEVAEEGGPSS